MRSLNGAQRVLDYRVFRHNFSKFPEYFRDLGKRYEDWRILVKETQNHPTLNGAGMFFKAQFKKIDTWYENYQRLWNTFFSIKNEKEVLSD